METRKESLTDIVGKVILYIIIEFAILLITFAAKIENENLRILLILTIVITFCYGIIKTVVIPQGNEPEIKEANLDVLKFTCRFINPNSKIDTYLFDKHEFEFREDGIAFFPRSNFLLLDWLMLVIKFKSKFHIGKKRGQRGGFFARWENIKECTINAKENRMDIIYDYFSRDSLFVIEYNEGTYNKIMEWVNVKVDPSKIKQV